MGYLGRGRRRPHSPPLADSRNCLKQPACPAGLAPATHGLEGWGSIADQDRSAAQLAGKPS